MFAGLLKSGICLALLVSLSSLSGVASAKDSEYRQIEWVELMPAEELQVLLNPPESLNEIEDGSEQDSVKGSSESDDQEMKSYLKVLNSTHVIQSFDNTKVRLPGFVVPLEMKDEFTSIEFLIVPYFGACLHLPPPPPNQIVYVKYPKGVKLTSFQDVFWFEGTLKVETVESEEATSAYVLSVDNISPYTD